MQGNSMIPTDRKFDERVLTRICQECGDVLDGLDLEAEQEREDCMCRSCRSVRDELDLDEGWSTYLASLKPHAVWLVEQLDNRLAGWKCMGGSMTFGQDSKGRRYVDTAKDFRFVAPGHKVEAVFGLEGVTLRNASQPPEWSVLFSFETPLPVILAACVAAVTAAAPDKTKLRTIADSVRAIPFPAVTTPEANVILADIAAKRESFAKWIEAQTEKL